MSEGLQALITVTALQALSLEFAKQVSIDNLLALFSPGGPPKPQHAGLLLRHDPNWLLDLCSLVAYV